MRLGPVGDESAGDIERRPSDQPECLHQPKLEPTIMTM